MLMGVALTAAENVNRRFDADRLGVVGRGQDKGRAPSEIKEQSSLW
jgi:hypothetical protein